MNPITRALCSLFEPDLKSLPGLEAKQWERLVRVARDSGVLARVYCLIQQHSLDAQLPGYARRHMQAALYHAQRQARQVRFEAEQLARQAGAASGNKLIFLKGAGYVLGAKTVGLGRTFSDIDVLVDKARLDATENRLNLYGWFQDKTSDYDQRYYRKWAHEIPPLQQSVRKTVLDLHHNLLPPVTNRAPDMRVFDAHLIPVTDAPGAYAFSPPAMTLHSMVHLFFNEEFSNGFRDLTDLHLLMVEYGQLQAYWDTLIELAEQTGFTRELYMGTRYCQAILNTPIPESATKRLTKYAPDGVKRRVIDALFGRVLLPSHRLVAEEGRGLAEFAALLRGHWLKMPLYLLLYHTISKAWFGIVKWFTGQDPKYPKNQQDSP